MRNRTAAIIIRWSALAQLAVLVTVLLAAPARGQTHAFTIRRTIEVTGTHHDRGQVVHLAGLSAAPDAPPTILALNWVLDTSGWFPTWRLVLLGRRDLLPAAIAHVTEAGRPMTGAAELAQVVPEPGRTYEAVLSYDPDAGALAVSLTDMSTGASVYSAGFHVSTYRGPLFPVQPLDGEGRLDATGVVLGDATISSAYVPAGTAWEIGIHEWAGPFLPARGFAGDEARATIRLSVPGPAPSGRYRIFWEGDGHRVELASLGSVSGERQLDFSPADLPLGRSKLVLEYVAGGRVLLQKTEAIVVGRATFTIDPLITDRAAGTAVTTVHVDASSTRSGLQVEVRASLFELVWDSDARTYRKVKRQRDLPVLRRRFNLADGGEWALPITVPLPDRPGLWSVTFQPKVDPDLTTVVTGEEHLFATYPPARIEPGEPYTIAVLPDTQYYAQDYPHIFTRQTQWIAAHAADERIALVLHVGDITNRNTAAQWKNARRSMGVLDGTVPYVLSVGNHDMQVEGEPTRGGTRFNESFSANDFPALRGTFEEGRLENSYHTFQIGDHKYLVLSLEFLPSDAILAWANAVASRYSDHKLILVTHLFTSGNGLPAPAPTHYSVVGDQEAPNGGREMWDEFVSRQPNSLLVLSGHICRRSIPHHVQLGAGGNRILQMLTDFQCEDNGGNGWLALLRFTPDGKVEVRSFSPYLDDHLNDANPLGFGDRFVVDLSGSAPVHE